ncbi:MAG: 3-oxoacyl-ACP reductase FabG [Candidatus Zixiibacteriota bacterium]|nr:MAG: 3-oxoacyl-ACP reductase FabG [candidate division Zixibacteria bacterium]
MINFNGKVALITGGSRGIGAATAKLFARLGADIAINYRANKDEAEKVKADIEGLGRQCLMSKADIAKRSNCENLIKTTIEKFGRMDILVNNAGIWTEAAIENMTDDILDCLLDINLKGCFYTASAAVPFMKKQKSGNIIFIASTAAQRGEAFHSHYAASKGALIALTKSLSTELADDNIRVNCVAPGWVDTDMSHEALIGPDASKILSLIPLGRAATAEEIAGPIVFLASDWAGFIDGEVLNVNGGAVLAG